MIKDLDTDEPITWLECDLMKESAKKINVEAKHALFKTFNASKSNNENKSRKLFYV